MPPRPAISVPRTIVFPDYSTDELLSIWDGICAKQRYEPTEAAASA
jgi:hypothetical protein